VSNKAESDIDGTVEVCSCDRNGELQPTTAIVITSNAFFMLCNLSMLLECDVIESSRMRLPEAIQLRVCEQTFKES